VYTHTQHRETTHVIFEKKNLDDNGIHSTAGYMSIMIPKKIRIRGLPSSVKVYAEAALTSLKGRKTVAFPGIVLECEGIRVDGAIVRDYAQVCGFRPSAAAPISFPFTLTFPLQVLIVLCR
jgi:hypothetical protein